MRYRLAALSAAAALLLCGCGDTSMLEEIAASSSQAATEQHTKSPAELSEPVHTTAETTTAAPTAAAIPDEPVSPDGDFDVDLTKLSAGVVYGVVYDMMCSPDQYLGKTVKMRGPFAYYKDETTGQEYFAVIISDAMACCSQGIEFVLTGEHTYPGDYPEPGTEITVIGRSNSYKEGVNTYIQLTNAQITEQ